MTGIISLLHRMFGLRVAVLVTALAMLAQVNPLIAQTLDMGKLAGAVFGSGNQNLVVILHGDGGPGRYDKYAQSVARSVPNTTVVTLTRPGFRGATGASPGQNGGRDHYTRRNNASLAQALAAMRSSLRPRRLIVVGHSGGAAQLATIIATHPGTVDVAILAACPCDVPRWRIHRKGQNNWHQSQSPLDFAARVPRSTRVIAVTFQNDGNTRPRFVEPYIETARQAGVNAELLVPPGGSHSWRAYQPVVDQLLRANLR